MVFYILFVCQFIIENKATVYPFLLVCFRTVRTLTPVWVVVSNRCSRCSSIFEKITVRCSAGPGHRAQICQYFLQHSQNIRELFLANDLIIFINDFFKLKIRVLKYPEIFSPLVYKKIRIGATEIWVLKNVWPFRWNTLKLIPLETFYSWHF